MQAVFTSETNGPIYARSEDIPSNISNIPHLFTGTTIMPVHGSAMVRTYIPANKVRPSGARSRRKQRRSRFTSWHSRLWQQELDTVAARGSSGLWLHNMRVGDLGTAASLLLYLPPCHSGCDPAQGSLG